MRELKFRVWDSTTKEMNPVLYLKLEGLNEFNEQAGFVLMQFTGLRDKNGKEIYEGDIVKYTEPNMGGYNDMTGVVEYMECGYWVNNTNTSSANPLFCETAELEVIGNIYEDGDVK